MTASVEMIYDGTYGRLASLVNRDKTGATMTSFAYTYNLDGYVTQVAREDGDTIKYQYDGVGRLMDEWRKASGASTVYRNRFQYDAVGNRTQWIADTPGDATTYNYTYNTLNQVTERTWSKSGDSYVETYAHDLNGNVTSKEERKSTVLQERWEYEWDSEDRLVKVVQKDGSLSTLKTVEYAYCPACGGGLTHRIVRSSTGAITKWLQYENEGGMQLRIDEKWDDDEPADGIDESDPWRTERVTYNGRSGIVKELVYRYASAATEAPMQVIPAYHHRGGYGTLSALSSSDGELIPGQLFDVDCGWQVSGPFDFTNVRASWLDLDTGLLFNSSGQVVDPDIGAPPSSQPEACPPNIPSNRDCTMKPDKEGEERDRLLNEAFQRSCAAIKAAGSIPGVPQDILDCMKDVCNGDRDFGIIQGGFWCFGGVAGYYRWGNKIHVCYWVIAPYGYDPLDAKVRTPQPFLDHTIAHEMVHLCGDKDEGECSPAERAGDFVEEAANDSYPKR